jgi:hypothetical protein
LKNSKAMMSELKKKYPGHSLKLVQNKKKQETIEVDGEQVSISWTPNIDKIKDKSVVPIMVRDLANLIDIQLGLVIPMDVGEPIDDDE